MRRSSMIVPNLFLGGAWNKVERMQSLATDGVTVSDRFGALYAADMFNQISPKGYNADIRGVS